MSKNEKAKLVTLLNYWTEHNREHSQEVKGWAAKAKSLNETKVAEEMLRAARYMDRASVFLTQSLKRLEEA